jgi:hypothetical protein
MANPATKGFPLLSGLSQSFSQQHFRLFCHFEEREIFVRSSTKIRFSLRSYLRRFLVPRNDKNAYKIRVNPRFRDSESVPSACHKNYSHQSLSSFSRRFLLRRNDKNTRKIRVNPRFRDSESASSACHKNHIINKKSRQLLTACYYIFYTKTYFVINFG